jgi:hypothetical protein
MLALFFGFLLSIGIAYFVQRTRARRPARAGCGAPLTPAGPLDDRAAAEADPAPSPPRVRPDETGDGAANEAADDTERPVVPTSAATEAEPEDAGTSTDDTDQPDDSEPSATGEAGSADVPAVPTKKIRSHPAVPTKAPVSTKRSRPGPATTAKKARGRATPTNKFTPLRAVPKNGKARNP